MIEFQSPEYELAAVNRSDTIQHPFFSPLVHWCKNTYAYRFGTSLGKDSLVIQDEKNIPQDTFNPKKTSQVIRMFQNGIKEFGDNFKIQIKKDMKTVGYDISEIGLSSPLGITTASYIPGELQSLFVKESELSIQTEQLEMSQGMFRVLSIVIQLAYNHMAMNPDCVIIDDIGEGLDFERSNAFIALIRDRALNSNTQYILSTNDRFVMNSVPLEDWTVLGRGNNGHTCVIYNNENSRKKFEDFRFTGLGNFDLIATDFLESDIKNNGRPL